MTCLQAETGVGCAIVLPALPVHHAPVFAGDWPVQRACRAVLGALAARWDEQKAALAEASERTASRAASSRAAMRVSFVRNKSAAEDAEWAQVRYWARDGIHPNDAGYTIWGEHIAQGIMRQALLS